VALARALTATPDVPAALRLYDRARRPVTQRLVRTARLMNRMAHARRLPGLRNAVMPTAVKVGGGPG
jgi:2-polyprenyl-6-methoxyphenol hydroxylase-like FAD-dependent oxidoreductase